VFPAGYVEFGLHLATELPTREESIREGLGENRLRPQVSLHRISSCTTEKVSDRVVDACMRSIHHQSGDFSMRIAQAFVAAKGCLSLTLGQTSGVAFFCNSLGSIDECPLAGRLRRPGMEATVSTNDLSVPGSASSPGDEGATRGVKRLGCFLFPSREMGASATRFQDQTGFVTAY
jgi:hypothetical protein